MRGQRRRNALALLRLGNRGEGRLRRGRGIGELLRQYLRRNQIRVELEGPHGRRR